MVLPEIKQSVAAKLDLLFQEKRPPLRRTFIKKSRYIKNRQK